jgi:hypothetical protein
MKTPTTLQIPDSPVTNEGDKSRDTNWQYPFVLMAESPEIELDYRHYRGLSSTISATVISFSTVLLAWAISNAPKQANVVHLLSIFFALLSISLAVLIQLTLHFGYKYQAKSRLGYAYTAIAKEKHESESAYIGQRERSDKLRRRSNIWFRSSDIAVVLSLATVVLSMLLMAGFWWPY